MRILFVELLGGFGDLLLALPAIHALARSHPGDELDVLTFSPGDALLRHDPHVSRVLSTSDHTDGAPRRAVEQALAASYDLVLTTTTYDGIGALCGGPDLWRGSPPDELVDRRFLRLLIADGLVDPALVDLPLTVVLTPQESVELGGSNVVLVPGSGMAVKRWPYWRQLAADLGADLAAGLDRPWSTEPVPGTRVLPPGDLRLLAAQLADVGRRGGVVVGGDTGPVRLAAAVGARTVGLYGPTAASRYGLGAAGISLQGLPGCEVRQPSAITEQECWWSGRCPLTGAGPACLADLSPIRVREALTAGNTLAG